MNTHVIEPTDPISLAGKSKIDIDMGVADRVIMQPYTGAGSQKIFVRVDDQPTNDALTLADFKPCAMMDLYGFRQLEIHPGRQCRFIHLLVMTMDLSDLQPGETTDFIMLTREW